MADFAGETDFADNHEVCGERLVRDCGDERQTHSEIGARFGQLHPTDDGCINLVTGERHSRTAFEDFEEDDRRRHLLRMWMSVPNSRELSAGMHTIFQDQTAGAVRGGFPSRTGKLIYETVGSLE